MKLLCCDDLKLAKSIQYSKVQIWRLEKQGMFPKRIEIGPGRRAWPSMKSTCGSPRALLIATARQSSILWIAQQSKLYRFRDIPTAPSPTLEVATDALGGEPVAATL